MAIAFVMKFTVSSHIVPHKRKTNGKIIATPAILSANEFAATAGMRRALAPDFSRISATRLRHARCLAAIDPAE
jgi:hypothetical protein